MTVEHMGKIILSTGNIMSAGAEVVRKPTSGKSNLELLDSLRSSFSNAMSSAKVILQASQGAPDSKDHLAKIPSGNSLSDDSQEAPLSLWTLADSGTLFVPSKQELDQGLCENPEEYDITVKLFFLPGAQPPHRCEYARAALQSVIDTLKVKGVDLLIVSFPNVSFDADDDSFDCEPSDNDVDEWSKTYKTLEEFHREGLVRKIGLSEFGSSRLAKLLPFTRIKPSVNQINVRDCCVVPKPLILYARQQGIELLTHNDCTDILPEGTLKNLLATEFNIVKEEDEIKPQWVVKYTAVIKDRGVVENKGFVELLPDFVSGTYHSPCVFVWNYNRSKHLGRL